MSLQRLPPETKLQILRMLGPAFFRKNVGRLIISRWWYQLARPILFQELSFSAEPLQRFIFASKRQGMIQSVQNHVTTVSLDLCGFEYWEFAGDDLNISEIDWLLVEAKTLQLNEHLTILGDIIRSFPGLQSLELEARPENPDPSDRSYDEKRDYLTILPVASLVSLSHLTCLEIDTVGTCLIEEGDDPKIHLCDIISTRLPTLRRLRCRMRTICCQILDVPGQASPRYLEDVIINLSLTDASGLYTYFRYPSRCVPVSGDTFQQLRKDMELKATELGRMMENPRIVRVVSYTYPAETIHSFDTLAEHRMQLTLPVSWDFDALADDQMQLTSPVSWSADGEEVEELIIVQDGFGSDSSED